MTGQALENVEKLRSMEGCTRSEAVAALGICKAYVVKLAKDNCINILKDVAPKSAKIELLKSLAASGFTAKEAAGEVSLALAYVYHLAREHDIRFIRPDLKLEPSPRVQQMAALYRSGKTLHEIGGHYKITRERVRQLLTRYYGITASDGGNQKRAALRRDKFEACRNSKSLKKWGCNFDQYVAIRDLKKPTRAWNAQRRNAANRSIAWELNLWQWWSIWQQSGKWSERGRGSGYMMCRFNDVGPYAVGNVYIATGCENSSREHAKTSGLPRGVSLHRGKFRATRQIAGKKNYLGSYHCPDLAHAAYLAAQKISQEHLTSLEQGAS